MRSGLAPSGDAGDNRRCRMKQGLRKCAFFNAIRHPTLTRTQSEIRDSHIN
jgi:hypothetical protein